MKEVKDMTDEELKEFKEKAYVDWNKADADLKKADADRDKAYVDWKMAETEIKRRKKRDVRNNEVNQK